MNNNLFNAEYFFNSAASTYQGHPLRFKTDSEGNLIDKTKLEYGIYSKYIKIEYTKLFYVKKHTIGFGDIIDFITEKTYIKDLIIFLTKGNCGCEQRRVLFNKWVKIPYLTFHFRELYVNDIEYLNTLKTISKQNRKFININNFNKMIMPSREDILKKENATKIINAEKKEPLKTEQIKRGCGCKNKKR